MTIAQSIRAAALSWPLGFLGTVESHILNIAFSNPGEPWECEPYEHWRTYMLLVAEALSPDIPREDLRSAAHAFEVAIRFATAHIGPTPEEIGEWRVELASLRKLAWGRHG